MQLENSFEVPASPEAAWELLMDVERIVPCMPGAELKEVVDENTFKAVMHVKLGPISLQFSTDISRTEVDEDALRLTMVAKARETRGKGGAQATIRSTLTPVESGTRVELLTDLTMSGAVAQYGRGVVADVSAQLTQRFAECIAAQLATAPLHGLSANGASPEALAPPSPQVEPVGGLGLALGALWRALLGLFRRG